MNGATPVGKVTIEIRSFSVPMIKPAVASAAAVVLGGTAVLLTYDLGHLSMHMMLHIASMNIVAPLLGALIITRRQLRSTPAS